MWKKNMYACCRWPMHKSFPQSTNLSILWTTTLLQDLWTTFNVEYICNFVFQPLPTEQNMQLEFKDLTTGTNVPKNFIPAVELVGITCIFITFCLFTVEVEKEILCLSFMFNLMCKLRLYIVTIISVLLW